MTLSTSKQVSLGATRFKAQNVKTNCESLDDRAGPKTVATLALARDQGKGVARCGPNSRPGSAIV